MRIVTAPLAALAVLAAAAACGEDEPGLADLSSLEGTAWLLASGVDVEGWEDVAPTATFVEGTVSGSTGCNRFRASYTVDGDTLELGEIAQTAMGCPPPADAVEREYASALESLRAWRAEDDELALLDADGTEITASFAEDGALSGSAGCNTYRTRYTMDRGAIEIDPPAATKKACAEPDGIMEQEAAFLAALPLAARYEVTGASLDLLTAEGTFVAEFTRAPGQ